MIASLALIVLAGPLSFLLTQGSSPSQPRAEPLNEEAQIPPAYARWVEEVAEMRDRGELEKAREHLTALLDAKPHLALAEAPDEVALPALARLDKVAESLGMLEVQFLARQKRVHRLSDNLEAEDPDLLAARQDLAGTMYTMGDRSGARAHYEAVFEARERSLAEDHPDLLGARQNLAAAMHAMGDLPGARAHFEAVLEVRERTLPDDHPKLIASRQNLAAMMYATGDLRGARVLFESVLESRIRTLPEGHPRLDDVRYNLAATMQAMGDLSSARKLLEAVLGARERALPEDHPKVLDARQGLAVTVKLMGDLPSARALEEAVLEARERTLAEGHPKLLSVRGNLAVTMFAMGDLAGARALQEAVLRAIERAFPGEHPQLLSARENLALTMKAMGDLAGARALQEVVLEARGRTLPEEHPRLLASRGNLALTMKAMGDLAGARALQEVVLEARARILPEDHPDLLMVQGNLAVTMKQMGDLDGARLLQEDVLEARERRFPEDHPRLLLTRGNLALTLMEVGDLDGARVQGVELAGGMLRRLALASTLSPREAREIVEAETQRHSMVRFLTDSAEFEGGQAVRFDLAETLRATASASDHGSMLNDNERQRMAAVRARLNDLVSGGPLDRQSPESFAAQLSELTFKRDRLEREIRSNLAAEGIVAGEVTSDAVTAALPKHAVAAGFLRHEKYVLDPDMSEIRSAGDVLAAHVLRRDGSLTELELGPADELADLAASWRAAIGVPLSSRGIGVVEATVTRDGERAAGREFRSRVLDPILEAAGDAERIFVCLDDMLFTVPLEALPLEEGNERLGDRVRLLHEVSFARLLSSREALTEEPSALLVGDVDYDGPRAAKVAIVSAPIDGLRSSSTASFTPLPATGPEARAAAQGFEDTFDREAVLLAGEMATKAAFHELAPGKRYVHVATHGWFAPETVPSTLDTRTDEGALWSRLSAQETVTGLAPMTLCGLAFAGANLGRDSLGRVPGIMTAEELAGIDLSECELAVLSACETNVGIRRAGQGIQSLQAALHAAGARSSITSLWKVDDAATRKLFERFYTYLWAERMPKAEALWKAKCDLRAEGHPVRDWAAWVLSGDPR